MKKFFRVAIPILIFLMLFGACGTIEKGKPPQEPTYEVVTPEEPEEVIEDEEPIEEVVEEVGEEPIEEPEETVEEEVEEIGGGWVEPLEEEIPEDYEIEEEYYEEPYNYSENYPQEEHVSYGDHLTAWGGVYWFGNQKETYYNLDMSYVVYLAHQNGLEGEYWVREDGCKMFGDYIILACNRDVHPYGSLVETSLGWGISLDTGAFAVNNPYQVDVAVNW